MKHIIVDFYYDIYNIKKECNFSGILKIKCRHMGDMMGTFDLRIGIDNYEIFYDFEEDEGYVKNQHESIIDMGNKKEILNYIKKIFLYQKDRKNVDKN